jgi:putative membrane protein
MWNALTAVVLVILAIAYAIGLRRLWNTNAGTQTVRKWQAASFAIGLASAATALLSKLDAWSDILFSAHMTQHEILMLVAAPLLALGQPLVASLRALPAGWARSLAGAFNRPGWLRVWRIVVHPFTAWLIHFVVLWVWHIPSLFQATLGNEFVHAAQHLSFLLSALLFWWAVMQGRDAAVNYGLAVVFMLTTAIHSGLLGALITFARTVWYPVYNGRTDPWGLTALQDQQIGGLIMWVPACTVYVAAGLALFAAWLRESERRVVKREAMAR